MSSTDRTRMGRVNDYNPHHYHQFPSTTVDDYVHDNKYLNELAATRFSSNTSAFAESEEENNIPAANPDARNTPSSAFISWPWNSVSLEKITSQLESPWIFPSSEVENECVEESNETLPSTSGPLRGSWSSSQVPAPRTILSKMFHRSQGRTLTAILLLVIILCGGGIQSAGSDHISHSGSSIDSREDINLDRLPQSPVTPRPPSSSSYPSNSPAVAQPSSLSSLPVRAVSTRPSSDISTTSTGDSEPSVPSHYDACPNAEPWCSSLDENEKLALEAIHALHHQLDDDKNGNIDLFESNEFLREELKYDRDYEKRQENFHRNNDNQVSVKELWEIWVKSEVHNWTVDHTAEWISLFVGLPQYQEKFIQLAINGTFLPRLAVNHQNFLTTNLGIKDVITRQKLTLKAQDVVLFGPPKDNTNHTKDAVLTTLLVVAVTVCYLVYCRYKSSQRDLVRMSKDMEALIKAEETLKDLQKDLELAKVDQERDKQAVSHRISSDDEDELNKLKDEVIVLRNELQRAEVELQDKCWVPPPALTHWLQYTYELESKAHSKKRASAEKQLKQAKDACDKLKKKRSSLMGAFVATHARSIDDVDKAILEARGALTEVTQELQERMHRWKQIEMLVKSSIVNNPGMQSLEILLQNRGRSHPYLGTGSIMSNSQDDIDDDASSIYCPSAVHKLVSTSAFMMFPGQNPQPVNPNISRSYQQQTSSSDYSSLTNYGGDSCRPSQSPDISRKERAPNISQSQSYQNTADLTDCNEASVSGPISNVHTPIARSKSVQSMLSLRERGMIRESSSKDSSNGEDDIVGDASEMMSAKDRRVTFRAAADRRTGQMRSYQGRQFGPQYEPMEFEEARSRKPMSASRLESSKSSDEESQGKKLPKEEPDLIKIPCNTTIQQSNTDTCIQSELPPAPTKNTVDLTTQTSEPNMLLLDNKTPEKSHTVEASCTQPEKSSFFKSISKLMRLPSDGLTLKKTKKTSKDSCLPPQKETKQILNGSSGLTASKNNVITEKSLFPNHTDDEDNLAPKSFSFRLKSRRKSTSKFFSSLRRKSNSGLSAS
ncbi:unnamed protein product [Orchesella dallaii]|uniref:SAM domain-containing protein n=1 Tax=Orchesella dallaii TaxID=48710 RepID=A0ABP1R2Z2_9HEXA